MFCSSDSALTLMVIPKNEDILQMVSISVNEMPLGLKCSFSLIAIIIKFSALQGTAILDFYACTAFVCLPFQCHVYLFVVGKILYI